MSDPKSQFMLVGGYKEGNFLLDSLAVAFEDTRRGLSPDAAARVNSMATFLTANVVKERTDNVAKVTTGDAAVISTITTAEKEKAECFNAYLDKIGAGNYGVETEAKPVTAQRSKPGTGNGMM
ncbi:MAG: hypothetical protein ACAH83_18380 [Alphaproteobacteria bacterium]